MISGNMKNKNIAFVLIFFAGVLLLGQSIFNFWIATVSSKLVENDFYNVFLFYIGASQKVIHYIPSNYYPQGVSMWDLFAGVWYSFAYSLFSGGVMLLLDFLFIREVRRNVKSRKFRRWLWAIIGLNIIDIIFFAWFGFYYYVILIGISSLFGILGSIIGLRD